jgi:hypothetical protein
MGQDGVSLVTWVIEHPSEVAQRVRDADLSLQKQGLKHIVLFDALDQTGDDWESRQALLRGLLELLLELRPTAAIRAKVFVRPDMLEEPTVRNFPDASKVMMSRIELTWTNIDLFGLLFVYLGNARDEGAAEAFRKRTKIVWERLQGASWTAPGDLAADAAAQERVFVDVAGPWMGSNRRRGNM